MAGTSSISGVVSGLQTDEILTKLRDIEMTGVRRLQAKQQAANSQLTAWQALNTKLLALKSAVSSLSLPSTFSARTVTVSDSTALSAIASGSAALGDYTFTVVGLATAHQVGSQGYADSNATPVGDGTITINGKVIDTTGLTLDGLRDAINGADCNVRASVVNTGSGATPYRLLLTSKETGLAGAITTSVNVAGATPPLFTDTQAAQDAHLRFGEGASAVDVYRSSNHISDAIDGITLDLTRAGTSPVTLRVATDAAGIKEKINAFVTAYNEAMTFIDQQSKYDAATGNSGALFGNFNLMRIQDEIYKTFSSAVEGLPSDLCLLSQAGLRRNLEGQLTLDEAQLDSLLTTNPTGVTKLFASFAQTSSDITYISSSEATKPSGADGYSLEITQLATRARVTAGVAQAGLLAADETLTLNGISVLLTAGMDQAAVLAAINAVSAQTGIAASATGADGTGAGGYLTLTRTGYGSSLHITAQSSLSSAGAITSGLGNLPVTETSFAGESGTGTGAAGLDVAGLIDGAAATGSGQSLTANTGDAAGLSLLVHSSTIGVKSPIIFTTGLGSQLDYLLSFITQDADSPYGTATDTLEAQVERLNDEILAAQASVDTKMAAVSRQFEAMEATLAKLQAQGDYLSSQLQQLAANSKAS